MKVAVFGKPGGGKSTLARQIATTANLPLQQLDLLQYELYVERWSFIHHWWITKRFLMSPFVKPLGWPQDSPMLKSTISSYRILRLSDRFWTAAFKARLLALQPEKRVYMIRRKSDVISLLAELEQQAAAFGDRYSGGQQRPMRTKGL